MANAQNDNEANIANVPLGAQILRKIHGGLNALVAEATKMAGALDACEAKEAIDGLVGGLGSATGEAAKHFGKFYKELDIADAEAEGKDADDDDVEAALAALGDDGEPNDDDDDLTPEERRAVENRIKKLEAELAHEGRLERVAITK